MSLDLTLLDEPAPWKPRSVFNSEAMFREVFMTCMHTWLTGEYVAKQADVLDRLANNYNEENSGHWLNSKPTETKEMEQSWL